MDKGTQGTIRHDLFLRYQLIEIIAFWEGRLTANHLMQSFDISRQQASKTINDYNRRIAPGNLVYDASIKGHHASASFVPRISKGIAHEYLSLISSLSGQNGSLHSVTIKPASCEILQPPVRTIDPVVIRAIVQACQDNMRLEVDYVSLKNPVSETRVIAPHTLVYSGARWHVRAYCEKNRDFRDFVLTRFRGQPVPVTPSDISVTDDANWNTWVEVVIKPDPRLHKEQRHLIEQDYGMVKGALRLKTRGPLTQYQLQLMQIDDKVLRGKPSSQQIIVENLEDLQRWLF